MNDTEWAVEMSDQDTAPDYYLDALKNARDLGPKDFADEVMGEAAAMLVDTGSIYPLMNAMILARQAFDKDMKLEMTNGPVIVTLEVRSDAETE